MKALLICTPLLFSLALAACSTLSSKPQSFNQLGQFSVYPLNSQTFRVSFQTSQAMSYAPAEEITLLKAAQTTVQNGFRYFTVLDDPSNVRHKSPRQAVIYSRPAYYPYRYHRRYAGFWPDPFYDIPHVVNLDPIQISYTIECFQTQQQAPNAFDALLILQSLGAKYGLSPSGEVLPPTIPSNKAK